MANTVRLVCPHCGQVAEYPVLTRDRQAETFCPGCGFTAPYDTFVPEKDSFPLGYVVYDSAIPSEDAGRPFRLSEGDNLIGRAPSAGPAMADIAVRTRDNGLSRCHFCIKAERSGASFRYLFRLAGGRNVTLVSGRPVLDGDLIELHDGDRISSSASVFTFHSDNN